MRSLYVKRPLIPNNPRTFAAVALTILGLLTLLFASFETGSAVRYVIVGVAYFCGAPLATFALYRAALRAGGRERLLWTLLAGGLLLRFAGDIVWLFAWGATPGYVLPPQIIYVASYLLLGGGMLCLVSLTTNRIARITALDTLTIVASVGSLIYFFVLDRPGAGVQDWQETLALLIHPSFDAALLFLGLVAFSAVQSSTFTRYLALAFLIFVIADIVYLFRASTVPYDPGSWSGILFAAGTLLIGLGVLHVSGEFESQVNINPWRVFSFWLGPLSPPGQYAFLLTWGGVLSAASRLCLRGRRADTALHGPARRARLLRYPREYQGSGRLSPRVGTEPSAPGIARNHETRRSRHILGARLDHGG